MKMLEIWFIIIIVSREIRVLFFPLNWNSFWKSTIRGWLSRLKMISAATPTFDTLLSFSFTEDTTHRETQRSLHYSKQLWEIWNQKWKSLNIRWVLIIDWKPHLKIAPIFMVCDSVSSLEADSPVFKGASELPFFAPPPLAWDLPTYPHDSRARENLDSLWRGWVFSWRKWFQYLGHGYWYKNKSLAWGLTESSCCQKLETITRNLLKTAKKEGFQDAIVFGRPAFVEKMMRAL